MPTGGVNLENIAEFKKAGAVAFGIGSALVNTKNEITEEYLQELTIRARQIQTISIFISINYSINYVMKITNYELFLVPPRWLFLKIETDEGIVGWGEPVIEGKAATVKTAVDELMEYLIGKNPMNIEDHWNVMYRGGFYRGGPILMSAICGIDQALWDIKGKFFKAPIHQLLGGKVRNSMKVYSWIGGDRPSEVGAAAKDMVDKGFTAVKMNATEELQYIDTS